MKMLLAITITAGILLAGAQAYVANSSRRTEQRPYEVLEKQDDIEIRLYPPVNMAAYESGGSIHEGQGGSFRVLAGYIFGGNDQGAQIPMTSPVEMRSSGDSSEMRFMMPTNIPMDSLPQPKDSRIRLFTEEGFHAATITYGGYSSAKDEQKHADRLRKHLEKAGIAFEPDLIVLGYNPPYQVVDRKNEVMFRLKEYPAAQR
jgi:hypothetical protein